MTLTPSFPVEKQKERLRSYKESLESKKHIGTLTKSIFTQEDISEGITPAAEAGFKAWRPNNYRLKIPVNWRHKGRYEIGRVPPGFHVEPGGAGVKTVRASDNILFQVGPNSVMGIYSLRRGTEKLWFKVPEDQFEAWLDAKVKEIEDVLLQEVKKLDLPLDYDSRIWIKHEDDIHGDEFIDSLPPDLFINDTYFKKVYQKGVEFKSPTYAKNFISNRALEKVAPDIVKELQEIKERLPAPELKKAPPATPGAGASPAAWLSYFYENRDRLGLDYSKVRG